jgi:hypothetical protein
MRLIIILFMVLCGNVMSAPITFGFTNPSFSGVGQGSHYLTVENQESSRLNAIQDAMDAAERASLREDENSTLSKFIRNLESRIYAQLSKTLVEQMFANENPVLYGSFVLEGSTVTYEVVTNDNLDEVIALTIVDEYGSTTLIEIPVGVGNFGLTADVINGAP